MLLKASFGEHDIGMFGRADIGKPVPYIDVGPAAPAQFKDMHFFAVRTMRAGFIGMRKGRDDHIF